MHVDLHFPSHAQARAGVQRSSVFCLFGKVIQVTGKTSRTRLRGPTHNRHAAHSYTVQKLQGLSSIPQRHGPCLLLLLYEGAPRYAASRSRSLNTPPAVTAAPAPGPRTIRGCAAP